MPDRRHVEFFGPDLARGPVISGSPQTAAVQLATALAQLRAPLLRSDDELRGHADFIRELADRLFPDWAADVRLDVGDLSGSSIATTIRANTGTYNLLECWLADGSGEGPTATAPDAVTWDTGVVVREFEVRKHYLIVTPQTSVAQVTVQYSGTRNWRWAVARNGRVFYSNLLIFP